MLLPSGTNGVKQMKRIIFGLLATVTVSSAAYADPQPGKVSGSIFGGTDFPVGGSVHKGTSATVPNLGVLNPALAGVPATLQIEERSHKRVYDQSLVIGGELAYGLSENAEVLGQLKYTSAKAKRLQVGNAVAGAPVNATLPVFGTFGKYKAWSAQVGYRQYFGATGGIRPYAAARLGIARTSKINATFEVPAANITIANAPFYKRSWAFSAGGDIGLSVPVAENFSLQAETGIQYAGNPRGDDSVISTIGLGSINNTGKRWSVPLTIRAKVAF
jgi:hypothetical protein